MFKVVIRKADGSLRFVISNSKKEASEIVKEALLLEPIYTSSVSDSLRTLFFEVVKTGEDGNAN